MYFSLPDFNIFAADKKGEQFTEDILLDLQSYSFCPSLPKSLLKFHQFSFLCPVRMSIVFVIQWIQEYFDHKNLNYCYLVLGKFVLFCISILLPLWISWQINFVFLFCCHSAFLGKLVLYFYSAATQFFVCCLTIINL